MNIYLSILYLFSSISFILALKLLSKPQSALRGNAIGALGMLIAIVATALLNDLLPAPYVVVALALGTVIGVVFATRIEFRAMPQLVALYNGFGGVASTLVAGVVLYYYPVGTESATTVGTQLAVVLSGIIGSVTLLGSVIAFAKLQGLVSEKAVRLPGGQLLKLIFGAAIIYMAVMIFRNPDVAQHYWIMSALAGVLGVLLVVPIGGADMPVVIALLNSYSGMAATATGFAIDNPLLIIAGTMVGASGIILTRIMCKAMNRSLNNVLIGGVGGASETITAGNEFYEGKTRSTTADEVALLMGLAKRIAVIPGYGMAVARAQTAVRGMAELLESKGIEVLYGIHPVAGRMPGHMNVLLAEENISYEKMIEMDLINPQMSTIDLVLVIGANDVVNPLARESQSGPLGGMPIINADQAKTVIVLKRSLSPGFSGAHNPLFIAENTLMYFADGKSGVEQITSALKDA